jgi:hypothetical protein
LNGELRIAESGNWKLNEIGTMAYLEPFTPFSDGWKIATDGRSTKSKGPTRISVEIKRDVVEKVEHISLSFSPGHRLENKKHLHIP